jgi:hypothetical protein
MAAEQVNFEIEEVNVGKDDVKLIDTLVRLVEHHEKVSDLRVMGYEVVEGEIVRFITSA